jgi:hypothetical protein
MILVMMIEKRKMERTILTKMMKTRMMKTLRSRKRKRVRAVINRILNSLH